MVVAVDASGIKVTDRGEWKRKIHGGKSKKGYLKIHVAVDVETKQILAIEVTDERTGDIKRFKPLVEQSSENANVKRVLADAAYDSRENFDFLEGKGIEAGIRPRRNSSGKAQGSWALRREVRKFLDDEEAWKGEKDYGQRWSVESFFSVLKRTFRERIRAHKLKNMIKEVKLKAFGYNLIMNLAETG